MVANFEKRVVGSVDVLIDTHQRANGYESFVSQRSQRSIYVNSFSETSDGQICVCGDPKARPGLCTCCGTRADLEGASIRHRSL